MKRPDTPIRDVHHIQITVAAAEVDAARAFYCGVLGLPEIPKPDSLAGRGGFWLKVGTREMHVGVEEGVDRRRTKAHIAYQVSHLDQWLDWLRDHGVEIAESVPIPGCRRFECRDPFGNRLELIEPLEP